MQPLRFIFCLRESLGFEAKDVGGLDVFPVFEPLIVGRQVGPGAVHRPIQLRLFLDVELSALFDGARDVVHLLDADEAGNRGGNRIVTEYVADGQACDAVVLLKVRAVWRAVTLENGVAGKGLNAEPADVVFFECCPEAGFVGDELGFGGVWREDDLHLVGILLDDFFEMGAIVRGDADKTGASGFLGPIEGRDRIFDLGVGMLAAFGEQAYPPQVNVVKAGLFHALIETFLELFGGPPLLKAAFPDMPGVAEVHLVTAALEGCAIGNDLFAAAGIDVVDAPFDAAGDDVAAVVLEIAAVDFISHPSIRLLASYYLDDAFPVAAEADGRDHQACSAAQAVFHIGVVIQNLGRIRFGFCVAAGGAGHRQSGANSSRGNGAITNKVTTCKFVGHLADLQGIS